MSFKCSPPLPMPVETLCSEPWRFSLSPFQVSPNTYYVAGQAWVGCYLIDTGAGLILIDTAIPESSYLLIDSIYKLGFDPCDIKMILLSHAHFDHFGAAAQMKNITGADIYLSKEDALFCEKCPDETYIPESGSHVQHFTPDKFYDDNTPITLGNITITTKLTPGHTVGCTSFFWEETNPVTNEVYTVAMHGGVGANTMNDDYYNKSNYLTPDLRERFFADVEKLKKISVDITLPSHPNQITITDRAGTYTHETQPFIDKTVWADFLESRAQQVRSLMNV